MSESVGRKSEVGSNYLISIPCRPPVGVDPSPLPRPESGVTVRPITYRPTAYSLQIRIPESVQVHGPYSYSIQQPLSNAGLHCTIVFQVEMCVRGVVRSGVGGGV